MCFVSCRLLPGEGQHDSAWKHARRRSCLVAPEECHGEARRYHEFITGFKAVIAHMTGRMLQTEARQGPCVHGTDSTLNSPKTLKTHRLGITSSAPPSSGQSWGGGLPSTGSAGITA